MDKMDKPIIDFEHKLVVGKGNPKEVSEQFEELKKWKNQTESH